MRYDAVMFDLDGTLANTLGDIAAAANHALAQLGRPTYDETEYPAFIGHGALWLAQRALGLSHEHLAPRMVELILAYYQQFGHTLTRPYDGIPQLLDALEQMNLPKVVLSNKPDQPAKRTVRDFFGQWRFESVVGQRDAVAVKPDPTSALALADQLNIAPARWLYLGDSDVDMQTANAAGMFAVGAAWGYCDRQTLQDANAHAIVDHPSQVLPLLTGA